MKTLLPTLAVSPLIATLVAASPSAPADDPLFLFYAQNLRASLFAGFLTLGSFLVAVNTFVIVNLKKEVYDHPGYRKILYDRREKKPETKFYGSLNRLSGLLFWTIVLAISTAVLQLTVGVIFRTRSSAIVCLAAAAATMVMLFISLINIRLNLKDWFQFWEKQAAIDEKAHRESISTSSSNSQT